METSADNADRMTLKETIRLLEAYRNPAKAKLLQGFFKTDKGEYGEGDVFWGVMVPQTREVAKQAAQLELSDIETLLCSPVHEQRLLSLLILVDQYQFAIKRRDAHAEKNIVEFYLAHSRNINNWDLVDLTAPRILGTSLLGKAKAERKVLYRLAASDNLWEKRIAIIATLAFIKNSEFEDTLKISEIFLHEKHDLMHKAVGWMLREIGKKNQVAEEAFLKKYHKIMPRTMLRYAIERFTGEKRRFYMKR